MIANELSNFKRFQPLSLIITSLPTGFKPMIALKLYKEGLAKLIFSEPVLFFVNPKVSYSVLRRTAPITGYACLFTESFFTGRGRTDLLKNSPLFQTADSLRIKLNSEQVVFMTGILRKCRRSKR